MSPWGTQSRHKTHAKCWTWFRIDLFLLIKYWLLLQAVDWKSKRLNLCLTWFYTCKIIGIFWHSILLQFKSIVSFKTCTYLMLFSRGNLKDTSVWQALNRYNCHIQMSILKAIYFRTFYSLFYMVCGHYI